MGIFVNREKIHPHSVFSLFWGENILVGPGRKHLGPTTYFPSFLPNQVHFKKVFLPVFSLKFSIHFVSLPNKHTLRSYHEFGNVICFLNRFIFFLIPIVHPQCTWFDNLSIINNILMLFNKKKKIYFLTHKKYEVYV